MPDSEKQKSSLTYSGFSLDMVRRKFGIKISMQPFFSNDIEDVSPTDLLKAILERSHRGRCKISGREFG
jgi:hypothetical protein